MTNTLDTKTIEEWRKNMNFFNTHKDEIRWKYGENRYIVIEDGKIIDNGLDNFALARKYTGRKVLITNIKSSERIVEISSPEIA